MGKNKYILLILIGMSELLFAKGTPEKYIVYFKDKPTNVDVTMLFNEKALENRKKFNIPFDERDYPVNADYVTQLKKKQTIILNTSNWLNAVLVSVDENNMQEIKQLPFVTLVEKVNKTANHSAIASVMEINECTEINDTEVFEDNYTSSFPQAQLLNGQYLHEQGFNGEDMTIAVCDNGFYNANNNPAFSHIFSENRLMGTYSYVYGDSSVYNDNIGKHGSNCFSFIGGLIANQYIGTAIKSKFYLFHTENNNYEKQIEEFNLATALERCNQLGVKVVSISLGYFIFNDEPSATYDTIDTKTNNTIGAKAVNMASSKGILVCVAAGNSDNGLWVTSPACADSALAIASVDINGVYANSSVGIPGDPRIKPNVAAVGKIPFLVNTAGQVGQFGSGTSYATPQLAGFAACLWQAFPAKTNWEIKTAIEQSASQYLTPDKRVGYGIPDFQKAYNLLASPTFVSNKSLENEIVIYPNPFQTTVNIIRNGNIRINSIEVLNNLGQSVYRSVKSEDNEISLPDLTKGMYLIQIATNKGLVIKKLIKD